MDTNMKKCPMCAEMFKEEVKICRYCGTIFNVSVRGYCRSCHDHVLLNDDGKCSCCGGEIIDRLIFNELIIEPVKPTLPVQVAAPVKTPVPVKAPVSSPVASPSSMPVYKASAPAVKRPGYLSFYTIVTWIWAGILMIGGTIGVIALIKDSAGGSFFSSFSPSVMGPS